MDVIILLVIAYYVIQFLFGDKNKKKQEEARLKQQKQRDARAAGSDTLSQKEPQSWEEAMQELESIFSGKPVETAEQKRAREEASYTRPEPKPYSSPTAPVNTEPQRRETASSRLRSRSANVSAEVGIDELELDSSNPIFNRSEVSGDGYGSSDYVISGQRAESLLRMVQSREALAEAVIVKEILDKPKSMRNRPSPGRRTT
ncbi:MAG: hypothetical protein LAT67_14135 [Balneolales bacterium]|nr:hypothetical protein [Balneolales bacterium]